MTIVSLTKSRLMAARQCGKRLYLEVRCPELALVTPQTKALFRGGEQVGEVARRLYGGGGGCVISCDSGLVNALAETRKYVRQHPRVPLFEATLQHDDVLVRADVLLPELDGWRLVEVKGTTEVKVEHLFDCAVQAWVIGNAGLNLTTIQLAHVNKRFVYQGDGVYQGLLVEQDVTSEVQELLPLVAESISGARATLNGPEPSIPVGKHCYQPRACPFVEYCWPSHGDYSVQFLGGNKATLGHWVAEGYVDLRHVPSDRLAPRQQQIQRVALRNEGELLKGADAAIASLGYPRYYLDFETVSEPIPRWPGTSPYEVLPFQWSCHYEPQPGTLKHSGFLDLSGVAPMRMLAESLIRSLGRHGPILMYTSYEKAVINRLIRRFPDLARSLEAIILRLVDLKPLAEQFCHPRMHGSWSLKAIAPLVAPEIAYKELEGIQYGNAASEGYLEAIDPATDDARKAQLKAQLWRYCRVDTEAMVRLLHFLATPAT